MRKKLFIKNMVCGRCIKVVKEELEKLNFKVEDISLGEAVISSQKKIDEKKINNVLAENGFELIDNHNMQLIEKIKTTIIDLIQNYSQNDFNKINFSKYISEKAGRSYQYLSTLFSSFEGITLEKYIINQKIEKVKELLVYDELTLSEIAYELNYSSVQHLSGQFKKVTGFTPSEFKKLKNKNRKPLDKIF